MNAYTYDKENYEQVIHDDGRIELIPKKRGLWAPEVGEKCFIINPDGEEDRDPWEDCMFDRRCLAHHNVWRTVESANRASKYQRLHNALFRAHEEVEPGYEFQVGKSNWFICIDLNNGAWVQVWKKTNLFTPCYSTKEKAGEAMELLKQEGVL